MRWLPAIQLAMAAAGTPWADMCVAVMVPDCDGYYGGGGPIYDSCGGYYGPGYGCPGYGIPLVGGLIGGVLGSYAPY
jgi:hypothetical protein